MRVPAYVVAEQPHAVPHDPGPEFSAGSLESVSEERRDHFTTRDGVAFAGTHLIVDFFGAQSLNDLELMERTLRRAVEAAGATLLHIHLHHFTPNAGVSGVAVLAESHISVHTWPECAYAAFDIFMCGDACPQRANAVLREAFQPTRTESIEHRRGVLDHAR